VSGVSPSALAEHAFLQGLPAEHTVGLSWVAPPQEWQYGAQAIQPTTAFELDGAAVLALCDSDPVFGYHLSRRLLTVAAERPHATRIRMADLYAAPRRRVGTS